MASPNDNTFIEAGHTIEVEGKERQYDQNIISDPNWIILDDVMRLLKVTTARAVQYHADSPTKKRWERKYAKITGRDRVFYSRKDVEDFITSRGPTATFEAKTGEPAAEPPQATISATKTAETIHHPSDEKHGVSQESLPPALIKAGEMSPEIAKFVDFHMKIVDENKDLKTQAHKAENQVVGWKTSLYWLVAVTVITVSGLSWFGFTNWNKVGELSRTKDELYTKTISLQEDVLKTKSALMSREAEIQRLRHPVETVNAQQ